MKSKVSNIGWFNKFKSNRKSYLVLKLLIIFYALSFFLPFLVNGDALLIKYNDTFYFPVFRLYPANIFNEESGGEANYRKLNARINSDNNSNFVLMPLYPYGPNENLLDELNQPPPTPPSVKNIFGTDDRGRDVFARVLYGFNVSVTFGLVVTVFSFLIGILFGGISGFYGGLTDIFFQRAVEIWSALPFLYT